MTVVKALNPLALYARSATVDLGRGASLFGVECALPVRTAKQNFLVDGSARQCIRIGFERLPPVWLNGIFRNMRTGGEGVAHGPTWAHQGGQAHSRRRRPLGHPHYPQGGQCRFLHLAGKQPADRQWNEGQLIIVHLDGKHLDRGRYAWDGTRLWLDLTLKHPTEMQLNFVYADVSDWK